MMNDDWFMDAAPAEVWLVSPSNYRSTVIELAVPEAVAEFTVAEPAEASKHGY